MLIENGPIISTEEAASEIIALLNNKRKAFVVLRSLAQHAGLKLSHFETTALCNVIDDEVNGSFTGIYDSRLYSISGTEDQADHSVGALKLEQVQAARGLQSLIQYQGINYELFFLDFGGSRQFYDDKSTDEKSEFARRHMERQKTEYIRRKICMPDYFVIVGEKSRQYVIEQVLSY